VRNQYGTTIFLTTHYIDEAEDADRVCIINHGKIAACAAPVEIKKDLLQNSLILDAADRNALTAELSAQGIPFTVNSHITAPYSGSAQNIIAKLKTELTVLKIHEPTLEDAYIQFLKKTGGNAQ